MAMAFSSCNREYLKQNVSLVKYKKKIENGHCSNQFGDN